MRTVPAKQRKRRALLLALALCIALLGSIALLYAETGHVCTGAHCPVCEGILRLQALLLTGALAFVALVSVGWACFPRLAAARPTLLWLPGCTPVTLCTRMND